MRCLAMVLALAACDEPARQAPPPPIAWLVAPAPSGFPLGALTGRLGRSQPPQPMVDLGLTLAPGVKATTPLHLATAWPVPGDGPPRAIAFGSEGDRPAVELIDVELGRVAWRDRSVCAAPVVGATADAIVCADANGIRAIGLDGKLKWRSLSAFIAFTDDRISVAGAGESIIVDAATGDELSRVKLPRGVSADAIIASCGDVGRELFAAGGDGRLVRIAEARGGPAVSWAVPIGQVRAIRACDGDAIVVTQAGAAGVSLIALARATGVQRARIDGVLGAWPARDGSDRLEVSTAAGVARYAADLTAPEVLGLPPLGELLASRGDRRLVRATPLTAVLLDRAGVRGYLPLAAPGVVLGDTTLLAGQWTGAPGETLHRLALPPPWRRTLRLPSRRAGVAVDAELRDLPAVMPLGDAGFAQPDTGMRAVTAAALDPVDGAALYALAVDGERAAIARADLAARRWRWQRVDGCGPGTPIGLAVAADVVVCATRGAGGGSLVRATSHDGAARWDWATESLDAIAAGGDAVVVHDAGRLAVLDAGDGHLRGHLASDDGAAVRVAIVVLDATLVVTASHGRVSARVGNGLLPVWSIAVAGVVRHLAASGDGVLVALEDGDAYRIDARTAAVVALPGLNLAWDAAGDVVTGHTVGGPITGAPLPTPAPTLTQLLKRPLQILHGDLDIPPPMSTPILAPPSLGDSWQLALYEPTGGLRARNDYAVVAPALAARGPAGSALVVTSGPGHREVLVLAPATGAPVRRVRLPDDAPEGTVFGTVVAGAPIAGVVLAAPLRVVVF